MNMMKVKSGMYCHRSVAALALTAFCVACATTPPPPADAPGAAESAATPVSEEVLALTPGPHTYQREMVLPRQFQGTAPQPAYVKVFPPEAQRPAEIAVSSGNPSFDEAAIADASGSGQIPIASPSSSIVEMICVDTGNRCPRKSPWAESRQLRELASLQVGFDRSKVAFIALFNRAVRDERISGDGKVVLKITVAPSGAATNCLVASNSFADETFGTAIAARACMIDFGPADVIDTTFSHYPIEFHPM